MKAAADHFKKQRDSGVIPVHSLCAQNIKELEELKATLEAKCENSRRITLLSPERMANARLSLVHQEVLHEVIMDGREMREQIQDEIVLLAEKTREINEIEKVFKKVFEENSMIDLRSYLCPIPGEYCLARRAALDTAGMELARLVEQINVLCWKVKFCVDGFQAHVQLHDIAIVRCGITDPHVASSQYIGLRVACLIKEPGKIDRWDTGTVGCRPNLIHNGRFLVFMDDGRDIYMNVPSHDSGDMTAAKSIPYGTDDDKMMMRRLCLMKALPMALQSYPEKSDTWSIDRPGVVNVLRDHARVPFLRKFLRKYPDWPLIPMKKRGNGDHVKQLKVVDVDCALCTVRYIPDANVDGRDCFQFPCHQHIHRDEVVYRGSTRFENIMIGQNEHSNVSRRARDKFRNHFDTAEPFLSEPVFSQPRYVDPAQSGRMRQVQEPTQAQFSRGQIEGRYRKQALIIKTRVPATPAPPSLKPHKKCKKDCLRDLDCDPYDSRFHQCSPLHIPSVCGWTRTKICQRIVSSKRPKEKIVETGSRITIDCFTFDDEIETDVYVTVQKKFVCNDDYAHGIERMPIPAVNSVDDEPPPELIYTNQRFPYDQTVDVNSINRGFCSGCSCEGDCSDATKCECQMLSAAEYERLPKGLKIPEMKGDKVYPYENRIIAGKYMGGIFECNDQCACNRSSCFNRVIQHPIKYPIQLFKTAESGWGVRTLADIPEGAFICTYAGALLTDEIADRLKNEDQYFADLDLRDTVEREKMFEDNETDEGLGGDFESDEDYENNSETSGDTFVATRNNGKRSKRPRTDDYREESVVPRETRRRNDEENFFKWDEYFGDNALFVVDAKNRGNIGRFLNHSCEPNVYVQHVMYDTHDLRLPHLAFFSNENIKAGAELCWNYSYEIDETKERIMCKCELLISMGEYNLVLLRLLQVNLFEKPRNTLENRQLNMFYYDRIHISAELGCEKMSEKQVMYSRNVTYPPGLLKIFDEILVNAADNKARDPKTMNEIRVDIDSPFGAAYCIALTLLDHTLHRGAAGKASSCRPRGHRFDLHAGFTKQKNDTISIWNNGRGLPVELHPTEKIYVPTLVFGSLFTSSNYDDQEVKIVGGRNGYGAKLCNIFSKEFTVETRDSQRKLHFRQRWHENMQKFDEPEVNPEVTKLADFTKRWIL
ncbi:unnamed protein product [Caenorhabditis auriculariae]|uniref:SET domain-containing protein n=1 Tax=Caenorhabditis auriculariae TaxID=2777116 RepID=A0A8S1GSL6_9PELO|nr:unnamed protein product [Caenorhabditis auriculariae]